MILIIVNPPGSERRCSWSVILDRLQVTVLYHPLDEKILMNLSLNNKIYAVHELVASSYKQPRSGFMYPSVVLYFPALTTPSVTYSAWKPTYRLNKNCEDMGREMVTPLSPFPFQWSNFEWGNHKLLRNTPFLITCGLHCTEKMCTEATDCWRWVVALAKSQCACCPWHGRLELAPHKSFGAYAACWSSAGFSVGQPVKTGMRVLGLGCRV